MGYDEQSGGESSISPPLWRWSTNGLILSLQDEYGI